MIDAEQRARFEEQGFLRLPGVFDRGVAEAMEERVWKTLERKFGIAREDPTTWCVAQPTGLQGLKQHRVFDPIGGPKLLAALDDLLGKERWKPPREWGQFLVNFPGPGPWRVPHRIWHTDFGYLGPPDRLFGALVFSFLSDVPAGSGGTLVVAGSHRVVRRFVRERPRPKLAKMKTTREALIHSHPWLKALASEAELPDRNEWLMGRDHEIDGVAVRVAELTGEAGDVILGHPWLLHAGSPNCGSRPRLMRVQRIHLHPDALRPAAGDE